MSTHTRPVIRPRHIALAVALALGSPLAFAVPINCEVTESNDDGTGDTAGTLSWAIKTANTDVVANHPAAHPGGGCTDNTITLKTDVTLTGVMLRLINSDVTIQSETGQRYTISGNNQFRPLFVKSGTVTIQNLNLANGLAQGGSGSSGGAGLGGALFVYDGSVTIKNVDFSDNYAKGGNSGGGGTGGGGMFGNSSSGGGGLFGGASSTAGGYGGTENYGGSGGIPSGSFGGDGGFGGGGGFATNAGLGGFGGGGGGTSLANNPGRGGFGGGAGTGNTYGNNGGFGGGGTRGEAGGYGGGTGAGTGHGGGAGFGGAIFVKKGSLTLDKVSFDSNHAQPGTGGSGAQGRGGAIFICTATQAGADCSGSIIEPASSCVTFSNNAATNDQADLFWSGATGGAHSTAEITGGNCGPTVTTGSADDVTTNSATLTGTVNDNGEAITAINFDYGTTNSYGTQIPATPSTLAAGAGETNVTAAIDALTCNTGYHFRVAATYADGIVNGNDANFLTLACTTGPSVTTSAATGITTTGATLNGSVTDVGLDISSIQYEYGTATGT